MAFFSSIKKFRLSYCLLFFKRVFPCFFSKTNSRLKKIIAAVFLINSSLSLKFIIWILSTLKGQTLLFYSSSQPSPAFIKGHQSTQYWGKIECMICSELSSSIRQNVTVYNKVYLDTITLERIKMNPVFWIAGKLWNYNIALLL